MFLALDRLLAVGVVPVIRAETETTALRIADALIGAGLGVIELTMTVPNATTAMLSIARQYGGEVVLGAGTVTSAAMAHAAIDSGCTFVVTPGIRADVIAAARTRQVPVICGALTPTEILTAHDAGADLVKVFPAGAVGGPAYIRAIRGPLPHIGLMATGGVGLDSVLAYFEAGVAALGVGGEMISRASVAAGDYRAIGDAARQFLEAARRAPRAARPRYARFQNQESS